MYVVSQEFEKVAHVLLSSNWCTQQTTKGANFFIQDQNCWSLFEFRRDDDVFNQRFQGVVDLQGK